MQYFILILAALTLGCSTPVFDHTYQGVSLKTDVTAGQSEGSGTSSLRGATDDRWYPRSYSEIGSSLHESTFWAVTVGAQWHFGYKPATLEPLSVAVPVLNRDARFPCLDPLDVPYVCDPLQGGK